MGRGNREDAALALRAPTMVVPRSRPSRLDESRFWAIIEAGRRRARADPEYQLAAVRKQLLKVLAEEVRDFHRLFNRKLADAYTWDLWGAGYLINGGCSDDGFHYFRAWLISRG